MLKFGELEWTLMHKGRVEAFSDAVIAIAMTVMVLELKVPHGTSIGALQEALPTLLFYVLSFVHLGIYWNNHHHMLQVANHVNGAVLWANMHLLFWLSLMPFATEWMGASGLVHWPVAFYGFILFMSGVAYYLLQRTLVAANGKDSNLAKALGADFKGKASVVIYAAAIGLSWVIPIASCVLFVAVACMWLVPDRRMEKAIDS